MYRDAVVRCRDATLCLLVWCEYWPLTDRVRRVGDT